MIKNFSLDFTEIFALQFCRGMISSLDLDLGVSQDVAFSEVVIRHQIEIRLSRRHQFNLSFTMA